MINKIYNLNPTTEKHCNLLDEFYDIIKRNLNKYNPNDIRLVVAMTLTLIEYHILHKTIGIEPEFIGDIKFDEEENYCIRIKIEVLSDRPKSKWPINTT